MGIGAAAFSVVHAATATRTDRFRARDQPPSRSPADRRNPSMSRV